MAVSDATCEAACAAVLPSSLTRLLATSNCCLGCREMIKPGRRALAGFGLIGRCLAGTADQFLVGVAIEQAGKLARWLASVTIGRLKAKEIAQRGPLAVRRGLRLC